MDLYAVHLDQGDLFRVTAQGSDGLDGVLRVFDASGRLVRTLVDATQASGVYRARWNGKNDRGRGVASGRYFYRLTVGKTVQTRGMVLLK